MKIGIIGGSYNPPHIAHLIIADRFTEQMKLDLTFFVPAYRSPFKISDDSFESSTSQQRLEMLDLAIESNEKFELDTVEIDREGVSYTIDTLKHFRQKFGAEAELYLLVGGDQAAAFTKWKDWEEILGYVQLCIARRPHTISPDVERAIAFHLSTDERSPVWIEAPILAVSSTEVRQRVAQNQSIHYLVPENVRQYIYHNNLYKMPENDGSWRI
ncbi:MAG: nicotinate (nicotinamide) nucleotide adenylyltransferase [Candidatus Kapabacteria bacterium]|jgi:nicotinate-nucleotide adenylyltransferase|nr:nicotinate (nicotinamide) nucleotide adenylyltransferase [Candidatus Kapabacteria bacterium]